jgi:hypothetical protein
MKLTEDQKELLKENDWDVVNNDHGNCAWVRASPKDGKIFGSLCETFNLTGDGEDIKLLVIGTTESE